MIKFIIDLLIPVFQKMGVSPVDVETYVTSLSGWSSVWKDGRADCKCSRRA